MPHVFVETNWLVDCCAPAHNRVPAALDLLRQARDGEIRLYLPSICLSEARYPLQQKFQTRLEADRVRRYVTWALARQGLTQDDATTVRRIIDQMESAVQNDLRDVPTTIRELTGNPGLEVVGYDAEMMDRAFEYAFLAPELKPLDQAVLAAVIIKAERLLRVENRDMFFCELDSVLQPWDRNGGRLERLAQIYDAANVWVCGDYLLQNPPLPVNWHHRPR